MYDISYKIYLIIEYIRGESSETLGQFFFMGRSAEGRESYGQRHSFLFLIPLCPDSFSPPLFSPKDWREMYGRSLQTFQPTLALQQKGARENKQNRHGFGNEKGSRFPQAGKYADLHFG